MSKLKWISDKNLKAAVSHLLNTAGIAQKKGIEELNKNVVDPFSALFSMSGFRISYEEWLKSEYTRQAQKSLQNHIGDFHQNILGSVQNWDNLKTGNIVDLVSKKHKIIAEVKNKHNTVSGGKQADLYASLEGLVMPKNSNYKGYTAYYVAIVPKTAKRYNKTFTPSNKEKGAKCPANELIREIDGASFYDLVTGEKNALLHLFYVLPSIITECTEDKYDVKDFDQLQSFFDEAYEKYDSTVE